MSSSDRSGRDGVHDQEPDLAGLDSSDIPPEDQEEIRRQIENVSQKNRISVGGESLKVKPARKDYAMPLVVNLLTAVLAAGVIFAVAAFFRTEEDAIQSDLLVDDTGQQALIEEIQREAEEQLSAQEQEIEEIEAELASVRAERQELAESVDERVEEREEELRADLEAELEAERQRLAEEGLSEEEIEEVIAEIRAERIAEIEEEVAQYRNELEAELAEAEAELDQQEAEFSEDLAEATDELEAIEQEAEARVADVRAEFEAELEAQEAEVAQAQEELAALEEQRARGEAAVREIAGSFAQIRDLLLNDELNEAEQAIDGLRDYLSDPSVQALDAVADRRDADEDMLASLEELIELRRENRELEEEIAEAQEIGDVEAEEELQEEVTQLEAELEDAEETIDGLEDELAEREEEISVVEAELDESDQQLSNLEQMVEQRDADIAALENEISSYEQELAERESELAALEETDSAQEISGLQEELSQMEQEMEELADQRDRLVSLEQAYEEYLGQQAAGLAGNDEELSSDARVALENFLSHDGIQSVFPDIDDRLEDYFDAFEESGRRRALIQSADLLFELAAIDQRSERIARVEDELSSADDDDRREFLGELARIIE